MGIYSSTRANAYADKIKAVYEYLGEVRKVADRLTPIEDVSSFQAQITALHAQLDLLVEASNVIVTATEVGELILTGSIPSIKQLLGIPFDYITQDELDAALLGLGNGGGGGGSGDLDGINNSITTINLLIEELDQYRLVQQVLLSGLETNYINIAGQLETTQSNTELVLQRLTVQEQYATLVDLRLVAIDQELISTVTGVQASNAILAGHTASIASTYNSISLINTSIDALESNLYLLESDVVANTSAISLMETVILGLGDDITAGSSQTLALKSVIGGSSNLLPNADFAVGANGWSITVAEEDWVNSVLEVNAWNTPEDVNCLSVLGQPTPLGQIVIQSPAVLISGSNHYIVSGYPCVDNGTIALSYKAFDAANNVVGQGTCPATFNVTTNPDFNNYTRTFVKFLASANAVKLRLYLTVTGDGDWIIQAGLFRPMIERAWAEQLGPSEWTPNVGGVPEALSEAIQTLTTDVSLINGELEAITTAATNLTARVGTAEAALVSEMITRANQYGATVSSINTLSASMTDVELDLAAQATTISGIQSTVSSINGTVSSHSTSLTSLQAQVDAIDEGTGGSGAAIAALDTRVTATEASITSMSTAITALESSVTSANKTFVQDEPPSTIGRTPGDMWIDSNDGNKVYILEGGTWVARSDNNHSKVFAQDTQPTASNIGDLWIETDNGNKVWMWNGSTWVDATDTRVTANATAISNLTTRVTAAEGTITSQSASIVSLTSSVTGAQNTANTALTNATTASAAAATANAALADIASDNILSPNEKSSVILERDVIIAEQSGIDAQATAYGIVLEKSNYDASITALTNYLASLTTAVLWSNLSGNTTIVGTTFRQKFGDVYNYRQLLLNKIFAVAKTSLDANASATTALTTRVTAAEGTITSQASSITALNSSIAGKADVSAVTSLTTQVTEMQGAGQNMLVNSTFNVNLTPWTLVGSDGGTMVRDAHGWTWQPQGMHAIVLFPPASGAVGTVGSTFLYAQQNVVCEAGKQYIGSAYMAAHRGKCFAYIIWYDQAGTVIGSPITADTVVPEAGQDLATGYTRVYLKATAPAGARKAGVCFGWRKSVAGGAGDNPYCWIIRPMFEEVGSLQLTPSKWNSGGVEMFASYSLTLDVNGYVSGYQSNNDGTTANFTILANNFSVMVPGGGAGMSWQNGTLWNKGAAYSVLVGQDMSPTTDVIFWIGPNPASASTLDKALAAFYVTETGSAYFSGTIYASIIGASAFELGSTRIHTGGGRLAPFTVKGAAYKGTGAKFAGTCELASFVSPNVGAGYDSKRCSRLITDVNLRVDMRANGESGDNDNLYLEVQYNGGTWVTIASKTSISVDNNGSWMMLIRYTSQATWDSMKFRARTTGGRTVVLGIEAEIDNTYETSNAASSSSGVDAGTGTGGTITGTTTGGTGSTGGTGGSGGSGGGGGSDPYCVVADMTYLPNGELVSAQSLQTYFPCWNGDINDPFIEMHPLLGMPEGYEECYIVVAENGCSVPQSKSTPIPLRDGRLVRTLECLHHEVLTNIDGVLEWSFVSSLVPLGVRRVVKPDLGDRVFFAGCNPRMTIATHNIAEKIP